MVFANKLIILFCILTVSVLLIGTYITQNDISKTSRSFLNLVYAVLLFLVSSFAGECLEGYAQLTAINFIVNVVIFLAVDVMIIAFVDYLYSFIEAHEDKNTKPLYVVIITTIIRVIVIIVLSTTGKLFVIENGYYVEKELASVPYIIEGFVMLEILVAIVLNRQCFSKRDFVVVIIYDLLPVLPIVIEMFTGLFVLTDIAVTISLLTVYVMIQAVTIEQGKYRENLLEEISSKDFLTGLNNRRLFYKDVANTAPNESIGILFCDINGLKYTNDTYGHAAGDELIKRFAGLITKAFGMDNVYRISGDEFVVLGRDISNMEFVDKVYGFKEILAKNEEIASVGYSFGAAGSIESLLKEAEDFMYKNKRMHHENLDR